MGSLIKYVGETHDGDRRLSYSRADLDGVPFRGREGGVMPSLIRQEEYEDLAERVCDGKVGIYNLLDEDQKNEYEDIIDRIANGWYKLIYRKHGIVATEEKYLVLIEYAPQYMELPPKGYRGDTTVLSGTRRAIQ